jgi:hypothetical protein
VERKDEKSETGERSTRGRFAGKGLPYLLELEPDIRAAALIDGDGTVLECTAAESGTSGTAIDPDGFGPAAVQLITAVDRAGSKPFDSCHIAAPEAEVFMVREEDLSLVAVTERFVLASLMAFDMRMALRDLAGSSDA